MHNSTQIGLCPNPGFIAGGAPEVVGNTIEVLAGSVEELKKQGVALVEVPQ